MGEKTEKMSPKKTNIRKMGDEAGEKVTQNLKYTKYV